MNCLKCGAPHVEEGKYCYECGAEIVEKIEPSVAPVVNETNDLETAAPALEQSVVEDANKEVVINVNVTGEVNKKNRTLLTIGIIEVGLLLLVAAFYVFKDYIM